MTQVSVMPDGTEIPHTTTAELDLLLAYRRALSRIAGDYPNATKEYKRSSFAMGAGEMIMELCPADCNRIEFARKVDAIRNSIFH